MEYAQVPRQQNGRQNGRQSVWMSSARSHIKFAWKKYQGCCTVMVLAVSDTQTQGILVWNQEDYVCDYWPHV